jgi:hypothetical protein
LPAFDVLSVAEYNSAPHEVARSIGCFTDKQLKPAEDAIRTAIGRMLPLWDVLLAHIRATYLCDQDWRFLYGKSYGWGQRFRGRGQLLTNLYPAAGGFTVQINLSENAVAEALSLATGVGVPLAAARAHPYPEGRWLFVPVTTEDDLCDVQALLTFRAQDRRIPLREPA